MSANHLLELAQDIVKRAQAAGATDAECTIAEGDEFSANVRMREVENLKEAGSRGAGLRILIGRHTGASYTSDLSPEGIAHLVKSAIELADITTEDPHAGLPDPDEFGTLDGDLGMYSAEVAGLDTGRKIETAKRAEDAALSSDPRISNSEGASFDNYVGRHIFANSRGFAGEYRSSYCSLSTSPVARDGESMERDYWYTMARGFAGLGSAGARRPHGGPARPAPAQRGQGGDPEGAGGLRAAHRALPAGQHLRSRPRHVDLPARIVPRRQAGRKGGQRRRHRDRRRHAARPVRHLAVRRRRRGLAAHRGDRTRRAEELPAEHLRGAQAGHEDHRQRVARAHRQRRHRARELFPGEGRPNAGADHRGNSRTDSM